MNIFDENAAELEESCQAAEKLGSEEKTKIEMESLAEDKVEEGERKDGTGRRLRLGIKLAIFLVMLCGLIYVIFQVITPKYVYSNDAGASTSRWNGFYAMEENSIDVLLLGSSHMGAGINPQTLYDEAGIRSYNLGSSGQAMWLSYYWLLEALQYQSPSVVVLDCYMMFIDRTENEASARQALDWMKNGKVKAEAAALVDSLYGIYDRDETNRGDIDSSSTNESSGALSYLLLNIRYHTRWTDLTEEDLTWWEGDAGILSKGCYRYWGTCDDETFEPLALESIADDVVADEFDKYAAIYLDKIVELCEAEGIELVLIKTPTRAETAERHVAIQEYADEHGLLFYDFNTEDLYMKISFVYSTDMYNSSSSGIMNAHANTSGARKMSIYLANQLIGVNGLEGVYDEQWEESREFNEHCWENFSLVTETDLVNYLEMLDQDRYSIFISVKDEASSCLTQEVVEAMQDLGFEFELPGCNQYSYIAIKNEGGITELLGDELLEANGSLRGGRVPYFVTSAGYDCGNTSSIMIDNTEYSKNKRGLNIVVYDNEIKTVIDKVCFDTHVGEWTLTR